MGVRLNIIAEVKRFRSGLRAAMQSVEPWVMVNDPADGSGDPPSSLLGQCTKDWVDTVEVLEELRDGSRPPDDPTAHPEAAEVWREHARGMYPQLWVFDSDKALTHAIDWLAVCLREMGSMGIEEHAARDLWDVHSRIQALLTTDQEITRWRVTAWLS